MTCMEFKKNEYGIRVRCTKFYQHEGEHTYAVVPITLDWKSDYSGINDEMVENTLGYVNRYKGSYRYSDSQVKAALWKYLDYRIGRLLEDLVNDFTDRLSERDIEQFLGEPEVDLKEESRLEHGDQLYDKATGN